MAYDTAGFSIVQGTTLPSFQETLLSGGAPLGIELDASVQFRLADYTTGAVKVLAAARVADPGAGIVAYDWATQDVDTPGLYRASWVITFPDGQQVILPSSHPTLIAVVSQPT